jgi:hypothetical protein
MNIIGLIVKETEKAYLIQLDKEHLEWFPKSQIKNIYMGRCDQEIEFRIPDWLAMKKFDDNTSGPFSAFSQYDLDDGYDGMDHILGTYFDQC